MRNNIEYNKKIEAFYNLIKDIIKTEDFCKMKEYRHHLHGSTYEHSIKVAYLCYEHYLKHSTRVDLKELIRAALLHDYFLYDHHDKNNHQGLVGIKHILKHPKKAAGNAQGAYPNLTKAEKDAIKHHMFPLTPIPPKTKCGWLVCWYDKVASIGDCLNKKEWKKKLSVCNLQF